MAHACLLHNGYVTYIMFWNELVEHMKLPSLIQVCVEQQPKGAGVQITIQVFAKFMAFTLIEFVIRYNELIYKCLHRSRVQDAMLYVIGMFKLICCWTFKITWHAN